jgi:hypothetical protein
MIDVMRPAVTSFADDTPVLDDVAFVIAPGLVVLEFLRSRRDGTT